LRKVKVLTVNTDAHCYLFGAGRSTCHVDDQDDASRKGPVDVQEIGWCSCGAPCGHALPRRAFLCAQRWLNVGDRWCPTGRRDQWERQPLRSARIDAKIRRDNSPPPADYGDRLSTVVTVEERRNGPRTMRLPDL